MATHELARQTRAVHRSMYKHTMIALNDMRTQRPLEHAWPRRERRACSIEGRRKSICPKQTCHPRSQCWDWGVSNMNCDRAANAVRIPPGIWRLAKHGLLWSYSTLRDMDHKKLNLSHTTIEHQKPFLVYL